MKSNKLINAIGNIKDKYIEEAFVAQKPTQQDIIKNKPIIFRRIKIYVACLLITVAGVILLPYLNNKNISLVNSNNSSTTVLNKFNGFVITAYAAKIPGDILTKDYQTETTTTKLKPNVEVLLASYSPFMSSVPGFPFIINNTDESIKRLVQVNNGEFSKWDIESGKVTSLGNYFYLDNNETIYWSPIYSSNNYDDSIIITVTAIKDNTKYGSQTINISFDGKYYKATVSDLISDPKIES